MTFGCPSIVRFAARQVPVTTGPSVQGAQPDAAARRHGLAGHRRRRTARAGPGVECELDSLAAHPTRSDRRSARPEAPTIGGCRGSWRSSIGCCRPARSTACWWRSICIRRRAASPRVAAMRAPTSGLFTSAACQQRFVELWRDIAPSTRIRPSFGDTIWPMNRSSRWGPTISRLAGTGAASGTRHSRNRPAADDHCGTAELGQPDGLLAFEPIDVPNVVYSVHMYIPHGFTHQNVYGATTPKVYPGEIDGRMWDKQQLEEALQPAIEFQQTYNVHMYIGEFSAIRWAPDNSAYRYLKDVIDILESHDWDWSYHAFREWDGWSVEHGADRQNRRRSVDYPRIARNFCGRGTSRIRNRSSLNADHGTRQSTIKCWCVTLVVCDGRRSRVRRRPARVDALCCSLRPVRCRSRRVPGLDNQAFALGHSGDHRLPRGHAGEFSGGKDRVAGAGRGRRRVLFLGTRRANLVHAAARAGRRLRGRGDDDPQSHRVRLARRVRLQLSQSDQGAGVSGLEARADLHECARQAAAAWRRRHA